MPSRSNGLISPISLKPKAAKRDGKPIQESELAALVQKLRPDFDAFNQLGVYGELTTFEILTALAFIRFREKKVDYQVLETGLGGRLDATNVVQPQVCAITSIALTIPRFWATP